MGILDRAGHALAACLLIGLPMACASQKTAIASPQSERDSTPQTSAPELLPPLPPLPRSAPFASEMYTFFVQDQVAPPTACRTVFVGSSSIRFWFSLEADFPDLIPLNRGFGGSQISNLITYFDRLLTPHMPREIIFYAGENDISAGLTPEQVIARFDAFMELKTDRLGDTPVYFVSIKPSVARFSELAAQTAVNAHISATAEHRADLIYVDVASAMLENGTPKPIFNSDQLHMNAEGYAIWTEILTDDLSDTNRLLAAHCAPSDP